MIDLLGRWPTISTLRPLTLVALGVVSLVPRAWAQVPAGPAVTRLSSPLDAQYANGGSSVSAPAQRLVAPPGSTPPEDSPALEGPRGAGLAGWQATAPPANYPVQQPRLASVPPGTGPAVPRAPAPQGGFRPIIVPPTPNYRPTPVNYDPPATPAGALRTADGQADRSRQFPGNLGPGNLGPGNQGPGSPVGPAAGGATPLIAPAGQNNLGPVLGPQGAAPAAPAGAGAGPGPGQFEPARIIALVNGEPILAGDALGLINQALAPFKERLTESQYQEQQTLLMKQFLKNLVEAKMLYLNFMSTLPDDKREQVMPKIWAQVYAKWDQVELPKAMKKAEVNTPAELDAKLREHGWSLAKQKRMFGERNLGTQGVLHEVNRHPEVTHEEMVRYYREHLADHQYPARVRWEQLSVHFEKAPEKATAQRMIAEMGNEVYFGTPFAAVAKQKSHGSHAGEGGYHDWVTPGALVSKPLDHAIFHLPIGKLSPIIEDERGFHIVRVIQREEARTTPFTEAQKEIREKLKEEKVDRAFREKIEEIRRGTRIWTIFDDLDFGEAQRAQRF